MTLIWFVVWLISNAVGDREALTFDPVNLWAGALLLAVALDLGRPHAAGRRREARAQEHAEPHRERSVRS